MAVSTIDNSGISASAAISTSKLGTGAVLQVVQGVSTSIVSTASTSFTSTGFSVSITPSFSTSKILVNMGISIQVANNSGSGGIGLAIYRNGSYIAGDTQGYNSFYIVTTGAVPRARVPMIYLDSPATTSSTTYTLYFAAWNSNTSYVNDAGQQSTITLMEIAG